MQFKSRRLLRVVSTVLGALVLGLLITIIALTLAREGSRADEGWIFVPLLLLPGLYVGKLISDSYSVLEIDEKGVRVRRLLGGEDNAWGHIASVRYWEQLQVVRGGTSREYFIELGGDDGKRFLRLKSTYDPAAYTHLMAQARARNIRVEVG